MRFCPDDHSAIIESTTPLSPRQVEALKAELQAAGYRAVILPPGCTVAAVAYRGEDDEDDE